MATGTYESVSHVMLVFAGHAKEKRQRRTTKRRIVSFISVLVMQIDG
jgi:hypothetical protein